ncbi:MAG: LexA family protein, partial [Rickettsiales bacterium]
IPVRSEVPSRSMDSLHEPGKEPEFVYYKTDRPGVFALKVKGRSYSMSRVAVPGQYIVVDPSQTDPVALDGKFIVAQYNGEYIFKRWRRNPDRLECYSDDPDYETIFLPQYNDLRIIGQVIGVISDLSD